MCSASNLLDVLRGLSVVSQPLVDILRGFDGGLGVEFRCTLVSF
jgi:hypothetical protein